MREGVNFEILLGKAASLPMVKIDRSEFLSSALRSHYNSAIIEKAITFNPAYAGIPVEEINKIAKDSISYETVKASALSFAAGIPGGLAMIGTIPADLTQYYAHILRILQKLIYLYGWQELGNENGSLDDKTAILFTVFTGVMFGVSGATTIISKLSGSAMQHAGKVIAKQTLTKFAFYRIVKKIATSLGVRMTKEIFAKGVSKVIPVVGGVASGGLTYFTYKPMAEKLRKYLATLQLCDVNFYKDHEYIELDFDDIIDKD